MYIKLLGENENGLPQDCTVGKVYEIVGYDSDGDLYFLDDVGDRDFAFADKSRETRQWQVVDKNGEAV
jgi:hypothetical protein